MDKTRLYLSLRKIMPWIITAVLLLLVFQKVGFRDILDQFTGETVRNVAVLGFVFYMFIFFANGYTYYHIFRQLDHPMPYREILSIRGASYLLTALNPGVGQGGMAFWISKKKSIPLKEVIGMMLLLPVVDIIFLVLILSVSLFVHYLSGGMLPSAHAAILVWALAAMWLALILHFAFWKAKFLAGSFKKIRESALLVGYRKAKMEHYLILFGIRFVMNMSGVFAYYLGLFFFAVSVPFWVYVVRFFPAIIIQALPVTVGQLGTSQGAWILMYQDFAKPATLAAFSLVWITVYNISRIFIGAVCFREEAKYYFEGNRQAATENIEPADNAQEESNG